MGQFYHYFILKINQNKGFFPLSLISSPVNRAILRQSQVYSSGFNGS